MDKDDLICRIRDCLVGLAVGSNKLNETIDDLVDLFDDNQGEDLKKLAKWIACDDTGLSSMNVLAVMTGCSGHRVYEPCDAGDFGRCYNLLKYYFPEWRPRIMEMASESHQWYMIAKNWDRLEVLYEMIVREREQMGTNNKSRFDTPVYNEFHKLICQLRDTPRWKAPTFKENEREPRCVPKPARSRPGNKA